MKWKKVLLGIAAVLTTLAGGYQANEMFGAVNGRGNYSERTVLDAVVAGTTSTPFGVADFQFLGWTVTTAATTATIRFACSMSETAPNFSGSRSSTNRWDYVDVTDLQNDNSIDGSVGIAFTNSTTIRQLQMEAVPFRWCVSILSDWTSGTTTVKLLTANNN